jgi:hypothetical protein
MTSKFRENTYSLILLVNKRILWLKQGIRVFPENSREYVYSLKVLVTCNIYIKIRIGDL